MSSKTLADLTYMVARDLGLISEGVATSGSTTTIVDTTYRAETDDYWNGGTAWILYDAGGAAAAPQGEWAVVSDYASSTSTVTLATFSTAVVASDRYALATNELKLQDIIQFINTALMDVGKVPQIDTSTVTITSDMTEYFIPVAATRDLRKVWYMTNQDANDSRWQEIFNWWVTPNNTAGGQDTLVLPVQLSSGYTVMLEYVDYHAPLYNSSDVLNDHVPVELVTWPAVLAGFEHLKRRTGQDTWNDLIAMWQQRVNDVKARLRVKLPRKAGHLMMVTDQVWPTIEDSEPNKVYLR